MPSICVSASKINPISHHSFLYFLNLVSLSFRFILSCFLCDHFLQAFYPLSEYILVIVCMSVFFQVPSSNVSLAIMVQVVKIIIGWGDFRPMVLYNWFSLLVRQSQKVFSLIQLPCQFSMASIA